MPRSEIVMAARGAAARMRYDDRTLAGLLLFVASTQFFLAMLIAVGSLSEYRVSSQAISDLGIGPTAPLFNTSIILLGLLNLAGAYFYHRTHRLKWLTLAFVLAGIGPIGVGIFPENVPAPHAAFALLSFLFGNLTAILVSTRVRAPFRYISPILGAVGLVALVFFVSGQFAGIGLGGMERLIVYPVLFWEASFGGHLMSAREAPVAASASAPAG